VVQAVQVRLGYRDRTQAVTERIVHPLGLVSKGTVWYLVADTDAGLRTFRLWRVQSVELTNDPVRRPPRFDLAETWQGIVARLDEQRQTKRVEALADPSIMGWLRGHFGNRLSIGGPLDDGRVAVEIGFPPSHDASLDLAGYSFGLEVINPPELREQLAAIGSRLVERYGQAA
jgi:predicted DNA-binding transcriptional regulator YafY